MVAKVVALGVIVVGGVVMLAKGNMESFQNSFENSNVAIGIAFYQGLWSYDGWNTLNYLTEELKRPEVNLPRALVIAISLVTGLYLLVNVSYLTVMTPKELMSSTAVAITWGNKVLGSWGWIMSLAAALSAFGSLNGTFFSGGRVCFVAAREGHMVPCCLFHLNTNICSLVFLRCHSVWTDLSQNKETGAPQTIQRQCHTLISTFVAIHNSSTSCLFLLLTGSHCPPHINPACGHFPRSGPHHRPTSNRVPICGVVYPKWRNSLRTFHPFQALPGNV
uniref:B(0,+)-type amino acid transporter 1-like n=1 Tax=Poecilia reticulata TaxID=8081 RepID=A0A3P9NEG7_POERE